MKVFIDANIVLDVLLHRMPFFEASLQTLAVCDAGGCDGAISTLTACNLMFVLRRYITLQKAREEILAMTEWLHLVALQPIDVTRALSEEHPDFEDAVQINCAAQWGADVIVTRNPKDFAHAAIPVLTPEDFLEREMRSSSSM